MKGAVKRVMVDRMRREVGARVARRDRADLALGNPNAQHRPTAFLRAVSASRLFVWEGSVAR